MKKRILIIGDSHTHSVKRSIANNEQHDDFYAQTFAKQKGDRVIGDIFFEEFLQEIKSEEEKFKAVVSFTGGNQHNSLSLIKHSEPFSIADEESKQYVGDDASTTLPREAFKWLLESGLRKGDFKKLQSIVNETSLPVYHVAATPPKKSTSHILKRPESDFVRKNIAKSGVSNASLRLEVYKVQMEITRKLCQQMNIKFIELPRTVCDDDGFLAEPYYADDATHANVAFADIVVSHIKSVVG